MITGSFGISRDRYAKTRREGANLRTDVGVRDVSLHKKTKEVRSPTRKVDSGM